MAHRFLMSTQCNQSLASDTNFFCSIMFPFSLFLYATALMSVYCVLSYQLACIFEYNCFPNFLFLDMNKSDTSSLTTLGLLQGSKYMEAENSGLHPAIEDYAVRFLKYECSTSTHSVLAEAPTTPDRVNDAGILEKSWEGELSEVWTLSFNL